MKPYQAVRLKHIEKMKELYSNEDWCREKNHHCDPESLNDSVGDLKINDKTDSIIFQAHFSGDYWKDPEGTKDEPIPVVYVYRHARDPHQLEYREVLEKDLKAQYGHHSLADYLQPEMLSRIFDSE